MATPKIITKVRKIKDDSGKFLKETFFSRISAGDLAHMETTDRPKTIQKIKDREVFW